MRTSKIAILLIAVLNFQFLSLFLYKPALARDISDTNFCNKIETVSNDNISALNKNRTMGKRHQMRVADKDEKLDKARGGYDKKRSQQFEIMLQAYKNPEQKEAIGQYRLTIQAAVELRRTTTDSARAEFRSKLSEITSMHRQQIDDAEASLVAKVQAAYENAKQACSSGSDNQDAKQSFITSMEQAKSEFATAKSGFKNEAELQFLIEQRNQKIQAAFDNFTKTLEQAKQQLLATLSND